MTWTNITSKGNGMCFLWSRWNKKLICMWHGAKSYKINSAFPLDTTEYAKHQHQSNFLNMFKHINYKQLQQYFNKRCNFINGQNSLGSLCRTTPKCSGYNGLDLLRHLSGLPSREVSKPRDLYFIPVDRSEIWQAALLPMRLSNLKVMR